MNIENARLEDSVTRGLLLRPNCIYVNRKSVYLGIIVPFLTVISRTIFPAFLWQEFGFVV